MSWKDFLRGDGYWMMAKDWIDVQRQGKLEAMSRKLAGGSQKVQRNTMRLKVERSSQRQVAGLLAVLTLGAGIYDLNRPGESLLVRAIVPDTHLESVPIASQLFKSLNIASGPGTAASLGGYSQAASSFSLNAQRGSNGLQE